MKTIPALICLLLLLSAHPADAQSSAFTYQGKLIDGGNPAIGSYDLRFRLFDSVSGGTQIGTDEEKDNVPVSAGIFTVVLDFGRAAFTSGGDRYLEISVRPGSSTGAYTLLQPRQSITSAPYAIKSGAADAANFAANSDALAGLAAENYVLINDPRMSDAREPLAGSANYIQNSTVQQPLSSFNVSGNGTVGGTLSANAVTSATQFNIGVERVLTVSGLNLTNTLTGVNTGTAITAGRFNSLYGNGSGQLITTGRNNSFFGSGSGGSTVGASDPNDESVGSNNSFFGRNSGAGNTASDNSFFGSFAGAANTIGTLNAFFGKEAGRSNTSGNYNTFVGGLAGFSNSNGVSNVFIGRESGYNNTNGGQNTFVGALSGNKNTSGASNTFVGNDAGRENVVGGSNSFFGESSGAANTGGSSNSFFGASSGLNNVGGASNSFFGTQSGARNASGNNNSAFGSGAGLNNSTGSRNTSVGSNSGFNSTGNDNTFTGNQSGVSLASGDDNVFVGSLSGRDFISGSRNIAIGSRSANSGSTPQQIGSDNVLIGANTALISPNTNNSVVIGNGAFATGSFEIALGTQFHTVRVFGEAHLASYLRIGQLNTGGTSSVCWNSSTGYLSNCSSSIRYKERVQDFRSGLDVVRLLRPVSFTWKSNQQRDLGLIAEEVAKVEPLLANYNSKGEVDGVKYDRVGVVLVNAVSEQQQLIDHQRAEIERLRSQIEELKLAVCAISPTAAICTKERDK